MAQINQLPDNIENFSKEIYAAYRKFFSGAIKESFLIEMLNMIEKHPRFMYLFFKTNDRNSLFSMNKIIFGNAYDTSNICKMIIMCHYANTVMLTDSERGQKQRDEQYKNDLANQVFQMYSIEKLAIINFNNICLESFLPVIYYSAALCNLCGTKFVEFQNKNTKVKNGLNSNFN